MTLLDLHIELAVTNELLKRIADALDRLAPLTAQPDHSAHPLIGLADISRMSPARAAASDRERATMPVRASQRVHFSDNPDAAADQRGAGEQASPPISATGAWDHDDPLDALEEFDRPWENYSGVDR